MIGILAKMPWAVIVNVGWSMLSLSILCVGLVGLEIGEAGMRLRIFREADGIFSNRFMKGALIIEASCSADGGSAIVQKVLIVRAYWSWGNTF